MATTAQTSAAKPPAERLGRHNQMKNAAGKAARMRQRVLAVFLPVTAALYVGAEALDPRGTDQVVTNTAALTVNDPVIRSPPWIDSRTLPPSSR